MTVWTKFLPGFLASRISANPDLQNVLGNSGWMVGDKLIRKIVALLVSVLMARYLGPQMYGHYSYAIALVLILAPVAILSLDAISVRRIVQNPESTNEVLGTSFYLMLGGGFIAFALSVSTILVLRPNDPLLQWLVIILGTAALFQGFMIIEYWFFAQVQSKYTVYAKLSAFLLSSLIKVLLVFLQAPLIAFAWVGLMETILGAAGLLAVYHKCGHSVFSWTFNWNTGRSMLKDSWPLILSGFLTLIYLRIDQIMLGNMVGSEDLGHYALAVQFSEVWIFIPTVICGSVFPAILKAETFSQELFYWRLQRLYGLVAFLSYILALPMCLFSHQIVGVLFGPAYAKAGPLLSVLIWTGLFTSLGAARDIFIVAKNWTRVNLVSIALGCAMNIVLNIILIPRQGAMGAAIATFISYWFTVHGSCFLFKPLRKTGWLITKAMIYPKFW